MDVTTHLPAQGVVPGPQVQWLAAHTAVSGQRLPQPPQLSRSVVMSAQTPLHKTKGAHESSDVDWPELEGAVTPDAEAETDVSDEDMPVEPDDPGAAEDDVCEDGAGDDPAVEALAADEDASVAEEAVKALEDVSAHPRQSPHVLPVPHTCVPWPAEGQEHPRASPAVHSVSWGAGDGWMHAHAN